MSAITPPNCMITGGGGAALIINLFDLKLGNSTISSLTFCNIKSIYLQHLFVHDKCDFIMNSKTDIALTFLYVRSNCRSCGRSPSARSNRLSYSVAEDILKW